MSVETSSSIRVYVCEGDIPADIEGHYLITVRVKVPRLLIVTGEEDLYSSPSRLDPAGPATDAVHSDPRVGAHDLVYVIADITDHPTCPTERSTEAADAWLNAQWRDVDALLKGRL